MNRPRVSILALMGLVAFVALGAVALREATDLWASCVFSLALVVFGFACSGAAFRHGQSRAFYAGFATFGLVYLALCFGPWASSEIRPHLVTDKLMSWASPRIEKNRAVPDPRQGNIWGANERRPPGNEVDNPPPVHWNTALGAWVRSGASEEFARTGHTLFALVAALVGGIAARYFHDTRTPQPAAHRGEVP